MLADPPQASSADTKKNSQGTKQHWRGFKLHWDIADGLPKTAMALRKECFFNANCIQMRYLAEPALSNT